MTVLTMVTDAIGDNALPFSVVTARLPAVENEIPDCAIMMAPFQSCLTVLVGLKLDPLAVAVTGSPAKTFAGCTEQAAPGDTGGAPPPNIKLRPTCSLRPRISARGVTDEAPYWQFEKA